jgi:hypothetical protein
MDLSIRLLDARLQWPALSLISHHRMLDQLLPMLGSSFCFVAHPAGKRDIVAPKRKWHQKWCPNYIC